MKVELHIIQSFAPSNLNRDDTGSPKDCEFGGVRRARVSSQCWKRAIRLNFKSMGMPPEDLSERSRRIATVLAEKMANEGRTAEAARKVVQNALAAIGFKVSKTGDSEYLLFLSNFALDQFRQACEKHWKTLDGLKEPKNVSKDVLSDLEVLLHSERALDLALFGRMIADRPNNSIDAACQVAHAISTHRSDLEFDYYTAVDDLLPEAEAGAGMIGSLEFNAACYYRYANIDLNQFSNNLGANRDLLAEGLRAFLSGAINAIPTGKQNSTAAQNPPSFILLVVRPTGLWSLANAFLKPVRAKSGGDLAEASIAEMSSYWTKLHQVYGSHPATWIGYTTLHDGAWTSVGKSYDSVSQLVTAALVEAKLSEAA